MLKRFICFGVVFLCVLVGGGSALASTAKVPELQNRLSAHLDALNNLKLKDVSTLYSNDSPENLKVWGKHYRSAMDLVAAIEGDLKDWKEHVDRNINDKIIQVHRATLQLALNSIFSRRNEFLAIYKLVGSHDSRLRSQLGLETNTDFNEQVSIWKEKAGYYLSSASESISKALKIDPNYVDALIVQAQISCLSGNYEQALREFNQLDESGYFKNRRSYYNSWVAFINTKRHQAVVEGDSPQPADFPSRFDVQTLDEIKENLTTAVAYMEPIDNKEWANAFKLQLSRANKEPYDFVFTPVNIFEDGMTIEQLKDATYQLISASRALLNAPTGDRGIRQPLSSDARNDVESYQESQLDVLLKISSNTGELNLNRYGALIDNLFKAGVFLSHAIELWDRLAIENESNNTYFVLNKATAELALLEIVLQTQSLIDNPALKRRMIELHAEREDERQDRLDAEYFERPRTDYAFVWKTWKDDSMSALDMELDKLAESTFLGQMMRFEYLALTAPQVATTLLQDLEANIEEYKFSVVPSRMVSGVFQDASLDTWGGGDCKDCQSWEDNSAWEVFKGSRSSAKAQLSEEIDGRNYVAAWKAYLSAKRGDLDESQQTLKMAQRLKGMEDWEDYQEKVLYLKKTLKAPAQ